MKTLKGFDYNNPGFQPREKSEQRTPVREVTRIENHQAFRTEQNH